MYRASLKSKVKEYQDVNIFLACNQPYLMECVQ